MTKKGTMDLAGIFIANETYKFLEKKAVAANLTVDKYVDQMVLLLKMVEEAKEVEKHEN